MADAITTNADVFIPQRTFSQIVWDTLQTKSPLLSSPAVADGNSFLAGPPGGSSITVARFDNSEASIAVNAAPQGYTAVESNELTMTTSEVEVQSKLISIALHKHTLADVVNGPGTLLSAMAQQVAQRVRNTLHKSILDAAMTTDLIYTDPGASITYGGIVSARGMWGEYMDTPGAVLVVHHKVLIDLLKLDEVKKIGDFGSAQGVAPVLDGALVRIGGNTVLVSNQIGYDSGSSGLYDCLIMAPGAILLYMKQTPEMEEKTTRGTLIRTVDIDFRFATWLNYQTPRPVVRYRVKATTA